MNFLSMQLRLRVLFPTAVFFGGCLPLAAAMAEISVEELAGRMVGNEELFVIDVRPGHQYEAGHIPGAVNIPVRQLPSRRLPALGEVIVYGDGLGKISIAEAVVLLAEKDGITPVALAGGYASWETRSGVTTEASGFRKSQETFITYQDLKHSEGKGTVLYDLRGGSDKSDLKSHFPQARIVRGDPHEQLSVPSGASPRTANGKEKKNPLLRAHPPAPPQVIVLVDDDHKTAAEVARRLRAGGLRRVVVLAGGELSVKTEGRSGTGRQNQRMIVAPEDPEEQSNKDGEEQP